MQHARRCASVFAVLLGCAGLELSACDTSAQGERAADVAAAGTDGPPPAANETATAGAPAGAAPAPAPSAATAASPTAQPASPPPHATQPPPQAGQPPAQATQPTPPATPPPAPPPTYPTDAPYYPGATAGEAVVAADGRLQQVSTTPDSGEQVFAHMQRSLDAHGWQLRSKHAADGQFALDATKIDRRIAVLIADRELVGAPDGTTRITVLVSP